MRILQAIAPPRTLNPGGAEGVVLNLTRSLQARGHAVFIGSTTGRPFTAHLAAQGFDVRPIALSGKLSPRAGMALARLARAESAQVIHAHLSTAALAASLAGRLARVPVVATVHGMTSPIYYRLVDQLIAVSDAVREHFARGGIASERIVVIPNGVNANLFEHLPDREHARREFGLPADAQVVGSVGRLSWAKGHEYLLQALAHLKPDFPRVHALIVGEGERLSYLASMAQSLGVTSAVTFAGYRPDVAVALAAMDVYVQASLEEGLPLALMEAMAAGIPAVGTYIGGIPELIEDGRTGLLVPARDPEQLARAIATLLEDSGLRARLVDAARAHVTEHHTWARAAEQVEAVYESLLQRRGATTAPRAEHGGRL